MHRWIRPIVIAASVLALMPLSSTCWPQNIDSMSGVGLIDFRDKPRFKVGDWVQYHFTSQTWEGQKLEDYNLVMIITGEEKFWGDDCFWIETWTKSQSSGTRGTAVCMSYSVFGDTAWLPRLKVYHRKLARQNEEGIEQELMRRSMKYKSLSGPRPSFTLLTDTLGTDTLTVPKGFYRAQKVQRRQGIGSIKEDADSTRRSEDWDRWTLYLSRQIPITSLARQTQEKWNTVKAWAPGRSQEAQTAETFRATGTLELVAFGSGDRLPQLTPVYARGKIFKGKSAERPARRRPGG